MTIFLLLPKRVPNTISEAKARRQGHEHLGCGCYPHTLIGDGNPWKHVASLIPPKSLFLSIGRIVFPSELLGSPQNTVNHMEYIVVDFAPWKKSYDKPRQHIKRQRYYFADKGPYSQSYGFFQ